MAKYLDLSAHYEVTLEDLLGKKAENTSVEKEVQTEENTSKSKEVNSK